MECKCIAIPMQARNGKGRVHAQCGLKARVHCLVLIGDKRGEVRGRLKVKVGYRPIPDEVVDEINA